MTDPTVTQFLIDITRGALKPAWAIDPKAVIDASDLSPEARTAIASADIATLWRMGVSPMALLYFSRLSGWSMDDYYACIAQASLTTGGQAAPGSQARNAPGQTTQ